MFWVIILCYVYVGEAMLLNGAARDGGNGATSGGVYWQGGPPMPPQLGRAFAAGYDNRAPGARPSYDSQMMPTAYGVPSFMPSMPMSGSIPR